MRRAILLLTMVAAVLLAFSGVVLAQPDTTTTDSSQKKGVIPDEYIVKLKDDAPDPETAKKEKEQKYGLTGKHTYKHALKGFSAHIPKKKVEEVRNDPEVEFVQEDHEVEASQTDVEDTSVDKGPSKKGPSAQQGTVALKSGDSSPTGVRRISAPTPGTAHKASNAQVAVIDTGIATHADLNRTVGKNCINPSSNPSANDDNGHGTHVAGTIAAKNNGSGVVGVAPGTPLRAVKVLDRNGSGSWSNVICGIDWVTQNASTVKVANMSLGGWNDGLQDDRNCGRTSGKIDLLHQAICTSTSAGVTYVVAAGNDTWALEDARWTAVPAAYNEVLAVAAMADSNGAPGGTWKAPSGCGTSATEEKYASFSNWAVTQEDQNHTAAGPGVCIKSTWLNGTYKTISGTSMATPHLAGNVALCIGNGGTSGPCAGMTPADTIKKIRDDAKAHSPYPAPSPPYYGYAGDPAYSSVSGKYFGYLAWSGGY
jgi:subtilisin